MLVNSNGQPLDKPTAGGNPNQRIPNRFAALIRRIQKTDEGKDFVRRPFEKGNVCSIACGMCHFTGPLHWCNLKLALTKNVNFSEPGCMLMVSWRFVSMSIWFRPMSCCM